MHSLYSFYDLGLLAVPTVQHVPGARSSAHRLLLKGQDRLWGKLVFFSALVIQLTLTTRQGRLSERPDGSPDPILVASA